MPGDSSPARSAAPASGTVLEVRDLSVEYLLEHGTVLAVDQAVRAAAASHLFAPECKKWLLQLAFGSSEAREAQQVGADQAGKQDIS